MGKGRGLVRCQLRSPALEPQLPSGEAGPPQEPALTWLGRARSPQEAEPTFTLLSYSSSVKYQASAPWVTKNPINEQFMFHMLPSDSKRVAKTAARLFQSGGLEVAGEVAGRGGPEGNQEGKGRFRMGRGGQALAAGLGEAWGWVELAQTDPGWPDQTAQGDRGQSKLLPGWVPGPQGPIVLHEDTPVSQPQGLSRETAHAGLQKDLLGARLDLQLPGPCGVGIRS